MENKFLILLVTITVHFLVTEGRTCYLYDYSKPCSGSNCLGTTQCKHEHEKCFSLYGYSSDGTLKALQKGCWKQDNSCSQTECVFRKISTSHSFCCCTGDLCNSSSPPSEASADTVKVTTAGQTSN